MQQTPQSSEHKNPLSHFINSISSYDSNIMLAAVISLLLVILFVLLLHIYAKWFLAQARQRRRSSSTSMTVSHVLLPSRFHNFHTFDHILSSGSSPPINKGLDTSAISSIPLFVFKQEEHTQGLECVICLTPFEDNDVGRSLTKCDHSFHVECIDMWLHSHSNCPICRAPALAENEAASDAKSMEVSSRESTEVDSTTSDGASRLDIVIDVSTPENESSSNPAINFDALSESSSSTSSSSSLGSSLRRMLSRNRSDRKVFPSSGVAEGAA
ncbi:hypothetical protein Tsubulata_029978 [Turnera subulata]|uniref:RING-type E3 ubiquitin transferase n=1 Tax=Turnera subulata TaxID=218843 RepID=A0A9Q0JD45_9ROSI|nr:hypothetical protein Tsubulata_029978 [Turnera subulata]